MPQDTGFPVLEGRASETRPPGNCGRLCRGTQVSQGEPLFWCTTNDEQGRVNCRPISERGMTIPEKSNRPYVPQATCIRRHAPPRNFRSPYYRIQVCLPETRVTEHTLPGPREASVQRPEPRGISGVRVPEHQFLRYRGTTIQGHAPVNLEGVRGESEREGRKKREG